VVFSIPSHGCNRFAVVENLRFAAACVDIGKVNAFTGRRGSMSRYCIWFVTPDDTVMRRAEVAINGSIHCHQVLEEIEAQLALDCGLSQVMIVDWRRFEQPEEQAAQFARAVA
jgi:hypothetical protein